MSLHCALEGVAKGSGSYIYNIYWTRSLFIFFSPVWKYCIVTQERINTSFCTERDVIGHLGAHWEGKQKRNAYGIFVCNGFSFIGMVLGDWHKGRGVWGRGVFWKTKTGSHSWQKIEQARRGMREFLFVCPGENLRSLFFPFISLFPPPTASSLHPLCFLFSSHYLTKLLFPPKHPPDLWQWGICTSTGTNTPFIIPPTNRLSCCFCVSVLSFSTSLSPPLCLLFFFSHIPCLLHPLFYHFLTCFIFFIPSCLALLLSTTLFFFSPEVLCSSLAPSPRPRPDIKGSMNEYLPSVTSEVHTCTHLHTPVLTHTHRVTNTNVDQVLTNKWTHEP